jgi:hypothetical protein
MHALATRHSLGVLPSWGKPSWVVAVRDGPSCVVLSLVESGAPQSRPMGRMQPAATSQPCTCLGLAAEPTWGRGRGQGCCVCAGCNNEPTSADARFLSLLPFSEKIRPRRPKILQSLPRDQSMAAPPTSFQCPSAQCRLLHNAAAAAAAACPSPSHSHSVFVPINSIPFPFLFSSTDWQPSQDLPP